MIRQKLTQFLDDPELGRVLAQGPLLVGVSGGADSVALLRLLQECQERRHIELIAVHYDHALRAESAEDAEWVQTLCRSLGIRCEIERHNAADRPSQNLSEEEARTLRYDFFLRTCERTGACGIALAHTADDQVETVLHHILRGSGLKGVRGIPAIRSLGANVESGGPLILRPLLQVSRNEIELFLQALAQSFRTDSTNARQDYTRNQIRHTLLPMLRSQLNPRVDQALLQLSAQAAEAQQLIEQIANDLLESALLERQPDSVRLQRDKLLSRSRGELRAMFVHLWDVQHWPRQSLGYAHLERLADLVLTQTPARLSLPGRIEAGCRPAIVEFRRRS